MDCRGGGRPLFVSRAALLVATVSLVAGCGGGPTLSDPREIAGKAQTAMASVTTLHFQADATGQMIVGVQETAAPGPSGSAVPSGSAGPSSSPFAASTPVSLSGATASGSVDLLAGNAEVGGAVPGLVIAGQVIVIGETAYVRGVGDSLYRQVATSSLAFNPADASAGPSILQGLLAIARDANVNATLLGTENCIEGACYHISAPISKDVANQNLGSGGLAVGGGELELWILTDSYRVAVAQFTSSDPNAGRVRARIGFTDFDKAVEISAPPAEQIATP